MGQRSKAKKLSRQTRNLKDTHAKQPEPTDNILKAKWKTGDYKQQLKSLGVKIRINDIQEAKIADAITTLEPLELTTTEFIQQVSELKAKQTYYYLSENECITLANLVKKYGKDVPKMTRDIDVNVMQWTEAQISKKLIKLEKEINAIF